MASVCTLCLKTFNSERGLLQHISRSTCGQVDKSNFLSKKRRTLPHWDNNTVPITNVTNNTTCAALLNSGTGSDSDSHTIIQKNPNDSDSDSYGLEETGVLVENEKIVVNKFSFPGSCVDDGVFDIDDNTKFTMDDGDNLSSSSDDSSDLDNHIGDSMSDGNLLFETDKNNVDSSYEGIYRKYIMQRQRNEQNPICDENKHIIHLLKILRKAKGSLALFDDIMDWAVDASTQGVLKAHDRTKSRSTHLSYILQGTQTMDLLPIQKEVYLPNAKLSISITTHNIEDCIISLLSDPEIFNDDNLLFFNEDDPFAGPSEFTHDHIYEDVHTGQWYRQSYVKTCINNNDILVPIIFVIDKTHVDVHGKLCQEPVWFTLGIFNFSTRRNPRAWRPLGYIPNEASFPSCSSNPGKISDYHIMLQCILEDLVALQTKNGFNWQFKYRGDEYDSIFLSKILLSHR